MQTSIKSEYTVQYVEMTKIVLQHYEFLDKQYIPPTFTGSCI